MAEFVYRSITPRDKESVRRLYYDFWRGETLASALGMEVPRECESFVQKYLTDGLHNEISVLAEDPKTGKVVGINMSTLSTPENPQDIKFQKNDHDSKTMAKQYEILHDLEITSDNFKHYNVDKILLSRGVCVLEEYHHRGIGRRMLEKTLEIARLLEISLAIWDCSSLYSRKICDRLGFEKVREIQLSDYKHEWRFEISKDSPHQLITRHVIRL